MHHNREAEIRKKPIEWMFPIEQLNKLAEREAHAKMYHRPPLTIHKWWARRLGSVFRTILIYALSDEESVKANLRDLREFFGMKGLLVADRLWKLHKKDVEVNATILDPMMGGGTTILEALKLGCSVIGVELNPVAWFIVKKMVEPVDIDLLDQTYERLEKTVGNEIKNYYKTICPHCGELADVMYYFWVKELPCMNCDAKVPLFKDYRIANARSSKQEFYYTFCPNCNVVFKAKNYRKKQVCTNCGHSFIPYNGNTIGTKYTCPECGQSYKVIDAIKRFGKPKEKLFALEYYCKECDKKGYKNIEEYDNSLLEKAVKEFEERKESWLGITIPTQKIPFGYNTKQMINFDYLYFKDMFNERQLLCLAKLLQAISKISNQNTQEYFLLAFSSLLNYSNMFCKYDATKNHLTDLFRTHAYHPSNTPVENNIWGTKFGRDTFSREYKKVRNGKLYLSKPFEKYIDRNGVTKEKDLKKSINCELVKKSEGLEGNRKCLLLCQSSDLLPLKDHSVDAVITDPPYYDNVMYSELSDFYYVWLRLILKDRYTHFRAELTPKEKEVIVNPIRDNALSKEERREKFLKGLTGIFEESNRVLKRDGLLVFTFHHKESEAWSSVLQSVLGAGFYVVSTYPIHSEMSTSTHIYEKQNISYDTIVACRKKTEQENQEEMPWKLIEDRVYSTAKKMAKQYTKMDGSKLSLPDMSVVVRGKCLEIFSQHYPNIVKEDGSIMGVHDALEKVTEIVDEHLVDERIREVSGKADKITALYLLLIAGRRDISYDAFHRQLQGRGLEPEDFTARKLLEKKDRLYVLTAEDRASFIEEMSIAERNALDKAHYLYFLSTSRRHSLVDRINEWAENDELKEWIDDSVVFVLKELASETGNKEYERIARYAEKYVGKELQWKLHQFLGGE